MSKNSNDSFEDAKTKQTPSDHSTSSKQSITDIERMRQISVRGISSLDGVVGMKKVFKLIMVKLKKKT